MQPKKCTVCDSPNATNFHFGAQSCKACAAFFRRTIKTDQVYECIGEPDSPPCEINHVFRINCRQCRLDKCLKAGMKEDLVQGRPNHPTRTATVIQPTPVRQRKRSSPVDDEIPVIFERNEPSYVYQEAPSTSEYQPYEIYASDNEWEVVQTYQPPPHKSMKMSNELMEIEELQEFIKIPAYNNFDEEDRLYSLASVYMEQVVNLSMRRKLTYTDKQLATMFDGWCACPFEKSDLVPFDIRTYRKRNRNDHTMILDYINRFPDFQKLNKSEKTVLFQTAAAVDVLVSQAYYSQLIFPNEPFHVTQKGEYLQMEPPPSLELDVSTGEFSVEDQSRYKAVITMFRRKWKHVSVPLRRLNMSLAEYALFKALTIWHYNYYKLQDNGRQISARQRDDIFRALLVICKDEGYEDPLLRVSELVLAVGIVMAEVHEMVTSFIELVVFDDVDDPILRDMLKFQY